MEDHILFRPKITHVAIIHKGDLYALPKPKRHCDIIKLMVENLGIPKPISCKNSGFLLNGEHYVGRVEAAKIALKTGQANKLHAPPQLYSEDLW